MIIMIVLSKKALGCKCYHCYFDAVIFYFLWQICHQCTIILAQIHIKLNQLAPRIHQTLNCLVYERYISCFQKLENLLLFSIKTLTCGVSRMMRYWTHESFLLVLLIQPRIPHAESSNCLLYTNWIIKRWLIHSNILAYTGILLACRGTSAVTVTVSQSLFIWIFPIF